MSEINALMAEPADTPSELRIIAKDEHRLSWADKEVLNKAASQHEALLKNATWLHDQLMEAHRVIKFREAEIAAVRDGNQYVTFPSLTAHLIVSETGVILDRH